MVQHQIRAVLYAPNLSVPRHTLAVAALPGYIVFAGGTTTPDSSDAVATVDIYDTVSGKNFTSNLSAPRRQLAGAAYGTKVYFAGGISDSGPSDVVDIFDVTLQSWTTAHLSQARYLLQAATVANKIIFVGGRINSSLASDVVDIYDPINNIWSATSLLVPRYSFGIAGSSTYGLIVGGYVQIGSAITTPAWIERFNPVTNQMEQFDLNYPSGLVAIGSAQTNSPEELMLFAGGYNGAISPLLELFYPNGTFYGNATMITPRLLPTPVCFPGTCYIAGGADTGFIDKLNATSITLSLAKTDYIRYYGSGAFDGNDTVAVGGGFNSNGLISAIEVTRMQRIPYKPYNVVIQPYTALVPFIYWDANIAFTTNFTVERWVSSDPQWRHLETISAQYYFTFDAGLEYNTTYRYRVVAISDTGISATSNEYAEFVTPNIPVPPTPTAVQAIVSSNNTIVISWTLGAVNKDEANMTFVIIERTVDLAENFTEIGRVLAPTSTFTDEQDLQVNVTYYYRAYAQATFRSEYSNVVSATLSPPPEIPPADPGQIVGPTPPDVAQIVPGVIIPIVVVAVAIIVLLVLLRRGKLRKVSFFAKLEYLVFSNKTLSLNIDLANTAIAERLHIPYAELTMIKQIGMGSYGEVYLGVWKQSHVAIKFCKRSLDIDEFLREAEVMLAIRPHPNIVQVLGVSTDGPQIALVLEFCQGGSLDTLLFDKEDEISPAQRIKLAAGIAAGIYHLHQSNIVHRDLASRNVLLTGDNQPKIADFGMSRLLQTDKDTGATKSDTGPIRWMAPESLRDKSYSTKSDVWSYGIILYELVSRQEPHVSEDPLQVGAKIRDQGYTPTIPADCPHVLKEIMESCWRFEQADRPDFAEICNKLNAAAATL